MQGDTFPVVYAVYLQSEHILQRGVGGLSTTHEENGADVTHVSVPLPTASQAVW